MKVVQICIYSEMSARKSGGVHFLEHAESESLQIPAERLTDDDAYIRFNSFNVERSSVYRIVAKCWEPEL